MEKIKSYEDQLNYIFESQYIITNEDNPCRKGWDLHTVELFTEKKITGQSPNKYYLFECYLNENLKDALFEIEDFFSGWIDTYINGKTSIYNLVNVYTPENLEKKITYYTSIVNEALKKRAIFLEQF